MKPTPAQIEAVAKAIRDVEEGKDSHVPAFEFEDHAKAAITAAAEVGEPIDYVDLIGKREIEWRAAAEDHVDEIERLKAELAATIERCAQVAESFEWTKDADNSDLATAIRALKDKP